MRSDLTRRDIVRRTGIAGTIGAAGCLNGNGNDTGTAGTTNQAGATRIITAVRTLPQEIDVGFQGTGDTSGTFQSMIGEQLGYRSAEQAVDADGSVVPHALADYEMENIANNPSEGEDPPKVTVTLRDDLSWANGDDVTTQDLAVSRWMILAWNADMTKDLPFYDPEIIDDKTMEWRFGFQANVEAMEFSFDHHEIYLHRDAGGVWDLYQELQTLSGEEKADFKEQETEQSSRVENTVKLRTIIDNGWVTGPYRPVEFSTESVVMEKRDDHRLADQLEIDEVELRNTTSTNFNQLVINDVLDIGSGPFPSDFENTAPDHLQTVEEYNTSRGQGIEVNWNNKHLARLNVRRAILAAIDAEAINGNSFGETIDPVQTNIGTPAEKQFLSEEQRSALYRYPAESDPDLATTFMENAGYTKEDDTWVGPDGDTPSFLLLVRSNSADGQLFMETLRGQLNEFGFDVTRESVGANAYNDRVSNQPENGWDLRRRGMGGEGTSYNTNIWFNPPGDEPPERWSGLGPTLRDDDVSKFGRPVSQPVPTYDQLSNDLVESGTTDGVEEMNVYNYYRRQYNGATSAEDVAELNRRLAPWWNFTVPSFHLTIRSDGVWGDTDNWQWPSEGSEAYTKGTLPRAEMIKNGRVAPK